MNVADPASAFRPVEPRSAATTDATVAVAESRTSRAVARALDGRDPQTAAANSTGMNGSSRLLANTASPRTTPAAVHQAGRSDRLARSQTNAVKQKR